MSKLPKLKSGQYNTVTLDIFDTVLIRRIWPEDLQFLIVADKWRDIIERVFSIDLDAVSIYLLRRDARNAVRSKRLIESYNPRYEMTDHVITDVMEWLIVFSKYLEMLSQHYLSISEREALLVNLIESELKIEKASLKLNKKLIKWLKRVSQKHPDTEITYLSDMYLRRQDINDLLEYFKATDVIKDGVTSADLRLGKFSGKLFTQYKEGKYASSTNLHIGDNHHSDINMAKAAGSHAIYHHSLKNRLWRKYKTNLGSQKLNKILHNHNKTILREFRNIISRNSYIGVNEIAPHFISYVSSVMLMANTTNIPYISISSEAITIKKVGNVLSSEFIKPIKFMPGINRRVSLLALIYTSALHGLDPMSILKGEQGVESSQEAHEFIWGDIRSKFKFIDRLVNEPTKEISDAYHTIKEVLTNSGSEIVLLDVGWNGTVQSFMQQVADIEGINIIVHGLYLGFRKGSRRLKKIKGVAKGLVIEDIGSGTGTELFVPDIWEYVLTGKKYGLENRNQSVDQLVTITKELRNWRFGSYQSLSEAMIPETINFFSKPSKEETDFFGDMIVESKFGPASTLVPSKKELIQLLRENPKELEAPYIWSGGIKTKYGDLINFSCK